MYSNKIPIVSQVNGIITKIGEDHGKIRIYISPEDNHVIYAPMTGTITNITSKNGKWNREIFKANFQVKYARVTVEIDEMIDFWIEVGKPKYITDRIRVTKKIGDKINVGENIGEIILGSLSEIHLLKGDFIVSKNVFLNNQVKGGETVLYWSKK